MPLTDTAVRNAKPGDKPAKMFDERGDSQCLTVFLRHSHGVSSVCSAPLKGFYLSYEDIVRQIIWRNTLSCAK
jgi:hypothetical protein